MIYRLANLYMTVSIVGSPSFQKRRSCEALLARAFLFDPTDTATMSSWSDEEKTAQQRKQYQSHNPNTVPNCSSASSSNPNALSA
jgi:hypothetical protein